MAKYPEKLRKHGRNPNLSDHVSGSGKVKKRLSSTAAKAIAARTDMNAYRCGVCGCHHVGRNFNQIREDGFGKGHRRG